MTDVRTSTERDTSGVVTFVAVHAAVVAVVVLLVAALVVPVLAAVLLAVVVGAAVTALRLRGIDDRIASAIGARALDPGDRPRLESVAESVAMAVGIPLPALLVIDDPARNAVVWGAGAGPVRCAFTVGLLDAVDRVQLEAVVGHQFALARDGCPERVTVGAALFGVVAKGPLEGPIASAVHRTVPDRSVVFADLEGVRATRYPPGLVAALATVRAGSTHVPALPAALSVLCFAAPDGAPGPFSVHPPVEDRIDLLREI